MIFLYQVDGWSKVVIEQYYRHWLLFLFILLIVTALESLIFFYLPLKSPSQKSAIKVKHIHLHLVTLSHLVSKPVPQKESLKKSIKKEPKKEIKKRSIQHKPQPKVEKRVTPKEQPHPKPHPIVKKVSKEVEAKTTSAMPPQKPVLKPVHTSTPHPLSTAMQCQAKEAVQKIDHKKMDRIKSAYLKKVRKTIERNKYYPRIAKKLHQTGVVEVQFTIQKDGRICCIKTIKASRYQRLNRSAKETIMRIERFEPLPAVFETASLQVSIPIVYRLQ
jgi:protein TonB